MSQVLPDFLMNNDPPSGLSNVERKKYLQKIRIIKHLYLNGANTNADICNTFNVSLPTSMSLLNQLVADGIVSKQGRGESVGGRKPDLFGLKKNIFFVLSIQVEKFKVKLAILDNTHQILHEKTVKTKISKDFKSVDVLYKYASELIKTSKIDTEKLLGIGISMPGLVSSEEGRNFTYFISDEEPESLQSALEKKFKKPVVILNDAKSACLAECRFGLAKNKNNVLVISMDWGIGLGIIMGGKMHTGASGFAGEFGHIPMVEDGLLCHCGKRGCLETVASGFALVEKAKQGIRNGQNSILSTLVHEDLDKLEPQVIIEAANRGDQFAINVLSEIGISLGKGIAILIQIFNPELIILEGKIAEAKQFIITPIQQSINTYSMIQLKERTEISLSTLGKNSSLLGATVAVMDHIFKGQIASVKSQIVK
ncbi:ROK family protein [Gillisia sp. M10.2A]|uniref:ROK family protein n=1 Tax=Gillisia lutea TaxID=2909668 RepID=A0ABS9ECK2_9FLAO|nr:ROK family protein [Gillisia lutea]MCF4100602.1 ROK family protein [Gillisia lutea]